MSKVKSSLKPSAQRKPYPTGGRPTQPAPLKADAEIAAQFKKQYGKHLCNTCCEDEELLHRLRRGVPCSDCGHDAYTMSSRVVGHEVLIRFVCDDTKEQAEFVVPLAEYELAYPLVEGNPVPMCAPKAHYQVIAARASWFRSLMTHVVAPQYYVDRDEPESSITGIHVMHADAVRVITIKVLPVEMGLIRDEL